MKVAYTNETQNFMHVGSVTIPPGETRDVDPSLLDGYKPEPGPEEEQPVDLIAELLKASVKNITVELPGLSDEDLARAAVLEQGGQNRKSLLAALTEETLRRVAIAKEAGETAPAADPAAVAGTGTGAE